MKGEEDSTKKLLLQTYLKPFTKIAMVIRFDWI